MHEHEHVHARDERALTVALALILGLTAVEVAGGLVARSLALLADAGHMLGDAGSLALALFAARIARRPASPQHTFGLRRAEILAALANGIALVVIAAWIVIEAYRRLREPATPVASLMLAVGAVGLGVNVAAAAVLVRTGSHSLNVRAALRHVLADLLGSVGVVVAAAAIVLTGWRAADPLVSLAIAALVLASSWSIVRDSVTVLLEATPAGIDAEAVGSTLVRVPGVQEVHDLHIWTITSGFPALSAHVLVGQSEDCHARRRDLEALLASEYGISHTTLQVDHVGDHEGTMHGSRFLPLGEKPASE
jgi:cobalt-zinc-cadmium efflux system protein